MISAHEYFMLEMIDSGMFGLLAMEYKRRAVRSLIDQGMVSVHYDQDDTEQDRPFFSITARGKEALDRHHLRQRLQGIRS